MNVYDDYWNCEQLTNFIEESRWPSSLLKVSATAWMDRKMVMVMSTSSQPTSHGTVKLWDRSSIEVPCPESMMMYSQFMRGVDHRDQLHGYYQCRSRSRKVCKYIFSFSLMWQSQMPTFWWSLLVNLTPSRISSPFDCSLPRSWLAITVVVAAEVVEVVSSTPFCFVTFPSGWVTVMDHGNHRGPCAHHRDVHSRCILTTWYCCECDEWLCHTGDQSGDCFLHWHTWLHVWTRHEPCTCSLFMLIIAIFTECSTVWKLAFHAKRCANITEPSPCG